MKMNIFGRQISALALGMTLMLTLAAASLLTYYGMFTGTATVTQSVLVDGESIDDSLGLKLAFDGEDIVAGKTYIETHTLENKAEAQAAVGFETGCGNTTEDEANQTATEIDWSKVYGTAVCNGITTTYVEYFDDAGADLEAYETIDDLGVCNLIVDGVDDSDGEYLTIQEAINNAEANDLICVRNGIYDEDLSINKTVTLASRNGADKVTIKGTVTIDSGEVTVKGFEVDADGADNGIVVTSGTDVVIESNYITGYDLDGVWVTDGEVTISNNKIEPNADGTASAASVDSIYLNGGTAVIDHNTLGNNHYTGNQQTGNADPNAWSTSAGISVHDGCTVTATYNHIYENDFGIHVKGNEDLSDGIPAPIVDAHYNNVVNTNDVDMFYEVMQESDTSYTAANATNNWWGTSGLYILAGNEDGYVDVNGYIDASYMVKTDMTLEPGEFDRFGIINDFDVRLAPDSYTITAGVTPY